MPTLILAERPITRMEWLPKEQCRPRPPEDDAFLRQWSELSYLQLTAVPVSGTSEAQPRNRKSGSICQTQPVPEITRFAALR